MNHQCSGWSRVADSTPARIVGKSASRVPLVRIISKYKRNKRICEAIFIVRRPQGDYAVRSTDSERASDILPTQREAIARARELNSSGTPLVERVRDTKHGGRDKDTGRISESPMEG